MKNATSYFQYYNFWKLKKKTRTKDLKEKRELKKLISGCLKGNSSINEEEFNQLLEQHPQKEIEKIIKISKTEDRFAMQILFYEKSPKEDAVYLIGMKYEEPLVLSEEDYFVSKKRFFNKLKFYIKEKYTWVTLVRDQILPTKNYLPLNFLNRLKKSNVSTLGYFFSFPLHLYQELKLSPINRPNKLSSSATSLKPASTDSTSFIEKVRIDEMELKFPLSSDFPISISGWLVTVRTSKNSHKMVEAILTEDEKLYSFIPGEIGEYIEADLISGRPRKLHRSIDDLPEPGILQGKEIDLSLECCDLHKNLNQEQQLLFMYPIDVKAVLGGKEKKVDGQIPRIIPFIIHIGNTNLRLEENPPRIKKV